MCAHTRAWGWGGGGVLFFLWVLRFGFLLFLCVCTLGASGRGGKCTYMNGEPRVCTLNQKSAKYERM